MSTAAGEIKRIETTREVYSQKSAESTKSRESNSCLESNRLQVSAERHRQAKARLAQQEQDAKRQAAERQRMRDEKEAMLKRIREQRQADLEAKRELARRTRMQQVALAASHLPLCCAVLCCAANPCAGRVFGNHWWRCGTHPLAHPPAHSLTLSHLGAGCSRPRPADAHTAATDGSIRGVREV